MACWSGMHGAICRLKSTDRNVRAGETRLLSYCMGCYDIVNWPGPGHYAIIHGSRSCSGPRPPCPSSRCAGDGPTAKAVGVLPYTNFLRTRVTDLQTFKNSADSRPSEMEGSRIEDIQSHFGGGLTRPLYSRTWQGFRICRTDVTLPAEQGLRARERVITAVMVENCSCSTKRARGWE
jgi:hypothetical protein